MKGITNYKPTGYEKKLFQKTDKIAREAKARLKKFSSNRK